MPTPNEEQHLALLPESLKRQLEKFKKDLWRIKITEAVLAGLLGLILSFCLVFAIDRLFDIPSIARLIILIIGASLFTIFAPYWINKWVLKHRRENQLARLISKHYPKLGDRLLGVVELQSQDEGQTALSPELREAAMIAVAHDAKDRDLQEAISATWRNKLALSAIAITSITAIAFISFPDAAKNAFKRWVMPFSDTERYTFTKVDRSIIPDPLYVPINEPFVIPLSLKPDTENTPDFAEAIFSNGKWNTFMLQNERYNLTFQGKRNNGTIRYKVGDADHNIEVRPIKRPRLSHIKGEIEYPSYLNRKTIVEDFVAGQLETLEGSKLSIIATADRKLKHAKVGPMVIEPAIPEQNLEEAEIQGLEADQTNPEKTEKISHLINGDAIIPEVITVSEHTYKIPLHWTDSYGISALRPIELNITSHSDQSPTTYILDSKKQIFLLHTEVLNLKLQAEDDYGIKAAGITWDGSFIIPSALKPSQTTEQFVVGDPYLTNSNEEISLDFRARKITPQKLNIRTWVDDYNPQTPRVYSDAIEVFLLTESEHANYQKERMKEAIAELEEIMRREQENLDENKRLKRDLSDPQKADQAREKLQDQLYKEQENKEDIEKLSKAMKDIFKEATKNKGIDAKTLKDLSDAAQQLQEMAQQDIPEIEDKLDAAQDKKNTQEKTKKDVQDAIKKQEELLKKMKETASKAEDANKKLEAGTFVNRLKEAANNEEVIAQDLLPDDGVYTADTYARLDPARQRLFQALFIQQNQTTSDIRWIEEDLAFFYSRTQKESHKKLLDDMQQSSLKEDLLKLERKIEKAHVYVPIVMANKAARQLREWAKSLDQKEESGGSGGGGGGGASNQEDQDFEFMLRVMRMIQKEQLIRARTRALEQTRRNALGIDSQKIRPTPEKLNPIK